MVHDLLPGLSGHVDDGEAHAVGRGVRLQLSGDGHGEPLAVRGPGGFAELTLRPRAPGDDPGPTAVSGGGGDLPGRVLGQLIER
jgi:hypothetical protein